MSVQGSIHLGPDEAIKRQNAERLQADVADLVLTLVGAYASKILGPILPHLPITLPPHFACDINQLASVYGTMMDWATEAVERIGAPQTRRSTNEAVSVLDFSRPSQLGSEGARVALAHATQTVMEAAWQLAAISPDDPAAQTQARWALGQAISELIAASARLMRLDAADRVARIEAAQMWAHREEFTAGFLVIEAVDRVPFLPGMEPGGRPVRTPTGVRPDDIEVVKPSQVPGPPSSQGGVAPSTLY